MHAEISPPHNLYKVMSILHISIIINLSNVVGVCCSLFFDQFIDAGEAASENQFSRWVQGKRYKVRSTYLSQRRIRIRRPSPGQ